MPSPSHIRLSHLVAFFESRYSTLARYSIGDRARQHPLGRNVKQVAIYKLPESWKPPAVGCWQSPTQNDNP